MKRFLPLSLLLAACSTESLTQTPSPDATVNSDARVGQDAAAADSGPSEDARVGQDAGSPDAPAPDAAATDAAAHFDAGSFDAGEETKSWQMPDLIEVHDRELADFPSIGVSANSDAVTAWLQLDTDTLAPTDVHGSRSQGGSPAWSMDAVIDGLRESPSPPRTSINASGLALVAWRQPSGTATFVWSDQFIPGMGWGTASPIYGAYPEPDGIVPVVDSMGQATIAWLDRGGSRRVWFGRFENSMWSDADRIDGDAVLAREVELAAGPSGEVLAVWSETSSIATTTSTEANIVARLYNPLTHVWAPAVRVDTLPGEARAPHVGIDGGGNALIVWAQDDGARVSVYSAYAPAGGSFEAPQLVEHDDQGTIDPASLIAGVGPRGDAFAVWMRSGGGAGGDGLWAARAPAGSSWEPAARIEALEARPARIAVDDHGHALLVWSSSADQVFGKRCFAGNWRASVQLTGGGDFAAHPDVGVDGQGNGIAVWAERMSLGLVTSIWSARYQQ